MALSDAKIRNAQPRSKSYKSSDGERLLVLVLENGLDIKGGRGGGVETRGRAERCDEA
jgi:hypothetical protein